MPRIPDVWLAYADVEVDGSRVDLGAVQGGDEIVLLPCKVVIMYRRKREG